VNGKGNKPRVATKKEDFFSKSNEEKNNGVKWKDLEVDTLIAIQGEMDAKFSKSAKKQGMLINVD
jgi:hypothetical protein